MQIKQQTSSKLINETRNYFLLYLTPRPKSMLGFEKDIISSVLMNLSILLSCLLNSVLINAFDEQKHP